MGAARETGLREPRTALAPHSSPPPAVGVALTNVKRTCVAASGEQFQAPDRSAVGGWAAGSDEQRFDDGRPRWSPSRERAATA